MNESPKRKTVHTLTQTLLAFFVEYNGRLYDLWLDGRADSAAFRLCEQRIEDLRPRIPQAQRTSAMRRFLTDSSFFQHNGSECSPNPPPLFLAAPVPNVLYQEETHAAN